MSYTKHCQICDALDSLTPGAEYILVGETITWKDSKQTQPSQSAIDAEITRLASDTSKDYIPKRIKASVSGFIPRFFAILAILF